jgi:hypothetical protein
VAQVVECLPGKYKALSLNPEPLKHKKEKHFLNQIEKYTKLTLHPWPRLCQNENIFSSCYWSKKFRVLEYGITVVFLLIVLKKDL